jgi:hypothetical protein
MLCSFYKCPVKLKSLRWDRARTDVTRDGPKSYGPFSEAEKRSAWSTKGENPYER